MARTPVETLQPNTEINPVQEKNVNELVEAGQQVSIAQAAVMDAEEAMKMVGRIEASVFMATVAEKMIAETAISLKQGKKYKGLAFIDEYGNGRQIATFEEFCQYKLGKSRRRVDELVSNYNQLGPDLYEQAEKIGFRQRDYNALKALPADDRALIAQAIEEESLEKALDILQEMSAKHVREKEALIKQTEELTHTIEAKDSVIKAKSAAIDIHVNKLALLETKQKTVSAEQRLLDLRSNLQITAADIKTNVMTMLRKNVQALVDYTEQTGTSEVAFIASCLIEISRELAILRADYYLPDAIDGSPVDPIWAAMAAGKELEVPGAAEFAARMTQQDSE